jgi:hypothetical protein
LGDWKKQQRVLVAPGFSPALRLALLFWLLPSAFLNLKF